MHLQKAHTSARSLHSSKMRMIRPSQYVIRSATHPTPPSNICSCFQHLLLQSRPLSSAAIRYAVPSLHAPTSRDQSAQKQDKKPAFDSQNPVQTPSYMEMTPAQRAARAAERARAKLQEQQAKLGSSRKLGGLADNSFFADQQSTSLGHQTSLKPQAPASELSRRTLDYMSFALNPRPNARARWQRKMLIRHIRNRGRLSRQVQIARTERSHLSKSHFFKTSMKKLAPLARQIAGKSIDEAILQMRFSKKKAASDVRAHLIQAKDEAIVARGMGIEGVANDPSSSDSPVAADAGITAPLPYQTPIKSTKAGLEKPQSEIYIAEAWVNRGPYGMEPEFRARGRVNILRPPFTGISVLLKEEKTRTREKADKEAKAIRKRLGKNMWTQLPDRPITRQSQHVLW